EMPTFQFMQLWVFFEATFCRDRAPGEESASHRETDWTRYITFEVNSFVTSGQLRITYRYC
ncbi:MAG: hypothetical protein WCY44_11395, partial [Sphaerochaetaceae bacterium]